MTMKNFKTRVNNKEEENIVVDAAKAFGFPAKDNWDVKNSVGVFFDFDSKALGFTLDMTFFEKSNVPELTPDQLQDKVVLHRNDVSDANWETEGEDQIYIDSSGKSFIFREQGWDKLQRHEMRQAMWEKAKQTPKSENPTIDTTYILLDGESAKKAWVNGSKIQISPIQAIPEWEDLNEKIATLDCFQKKWLFRCKPLTIMINGTELKPWNSIQVNYENFQIKIECIDDESADQSYKALQKVFSKRLNNWSNN